MTILNEIDLRVSCADLVHQNVIATGLFVTHVDSRANAGATGSTGVPSTPSTNNSTKQGSQAVTPVMLVALTFDKIYLLDWKGNERCGNGPNKILYEFSKKIASIRSEQQGSVTTLVIREGGTTAEIRAKLGFFAPNRAMNRKFVKELMERFSK